MPLYSLPRTAVPARVVLTAGDPLIGSLFVMERVAQHDGGETALEMLNRLEPFYAFRPDGGGGVLLIAKAHTVAASVAGAPITDPARRSAAQFADLELVLEGGSTIKGRAQFELPEGHQRPLDYLNASTDAFFAVTQGATTHYVNRVHVLYARPAE